VNTANEATVRSFLAETLGFCDIPQACRAVLDQHNFDPTPSLTELLRRERWAREEITRWT
jgi:1-deoxy-D-xylulose-5-phosphate reductoisomerase